jgi:hypothetical protein
VHQFFEGEVGVLVREEFREQQGRPVSGEKLSSERK